MPPEPGFVPFLFSRQQTSFGVAGWLPASQSTHIHGTHSLRFPQPDWLSKLHDPTPHARGEIFLGCTGYSPEHKIACALPSQVGSRSVTNHSLLFPDFVRTLSETLINNLTNLRYCLSVRKKIDACQEKVGHVHSRNGLGRSISTVNP